MPALDLWLPRTMTMAVSRDDEHARSTTVLDHLLLFREHRDARPDLLKPAMPSPTPLHAHTTMTTVRHRDCPQHPAEPI